MASEEACEQSDFSVVVSSVDTPNEPVDGDVGQGLDGHDPSMLSYVSPVNPSLRTQSWGDVMEASLWVEEVSFENDGVSSEKPKSNESCVMTNLPNEEEYQASRSVGNGQTEANFWYCVELDPRVDPERCVDPVVDMKYCETEETEFEARG